MSFQELLDLCRKGQANICVDSRKVQPGDIFVAIPGEQENGAQYIPAALAGGAAHIVCQPGLWEGAVAHDNPRQALWQLAQARYHTENLPVNVIGITGTNGKTTCTYLFEKLLGELGHKTGVLGTVSYRWPGHSKPAPLTTPDALEVHSMLAEMAKAGCDYAVMEVSSHALAQERVGGVPFAGAAFTNLTQDHLDFHKDMQKYFACKSRLFQDFPLKNKKMAINADDSWGQRLLDGFPTALGYGLSRPATPSGRYLWGELLHAGTDGCHMRMHLDGRTWELHSRLVGAFNAANLLTVQALALELGFAPEDFAQLESFAGVSGRLERVINDKGLHVFVDYAHTPDALVNVLKALRAAGFRRIVAVFGCGGNRDRSKRPLMGQAVAQYADVAVLTSDNPRFEEPLAIMDDVRPGLAGAAQVICEVDRREATARALALLGPDDALLVAGKGHEDYQIINGVKHHYSDQEVVREILACA